MTTTEPISGLCNLRAVPGVRANVVWRSDVPLWLDAEQIAALGGPGIQIDLRGTKECEHDGPGVLEGAGWTRHHLAFGEIGPRPDGPMPDFTDRAAAYSYITSIGVGAVADAFELLAGAEVPVLFHCTAGKDRTGILAIALGLALGVPREVAVADYVRSAKVIEEIDRRYLSLPSVRTHDSPVTPSAFPVTAEMAGTVLDTIAANGGLDAWLATAGAAPDLSDRIRARLG
ncbi:MAG TPA: tyrosine-protein phosphatase [Mycobacteriales bacterium]|nr:tyrosine-protein phosphatase [Mycobacteriales bacterium]